MKYLYSFLIIAFGSLLLIKTDWFLNFSGRIAWAEEHLGTEGGTRILIKIIGLIIIIGTFLTLFGVTQSILRGIFNIDTFSSPTVVE